MGNIDRIKTPDGTTSMIQDTVSGYQTASDVQTAISGKQDTLVSGTNIKTINNTSILGSGDIDAQNIFWCTYGTTTYEEITVALEAGKIPACYRSNYYYVILAKSSGSLSYIFICANGSNSRKLTCATDNTWSSSVTSLEVASNKETSISSASTDTEYPSAKCVYDNLQTKQDTLVSGTNIKTINNTSLLDSGNIDTQDIFWCTYSETTYEEITTALNAGKLPIATRSTYKYILSTAGSTYYVFTSLAKNSSKYLQCNSTGTWSNGTKTLEDTANKETSISSASTDTEYPSSKCVYDNLQTKQDTLVSGTNIKTINNQSVLGSGDITIQSTPALDNSTINLNSNSQLQAIGTIDSRDNSTALKYWTGTQNNYIEVGNYFAYTYNNTTVYVRKLTPTTSDTVYSAIGTVSALTITAVGTNSITLSDSNTYTRVPASDTCDDNAYSANTLYNVIDNSSEDSLVTGYHPPLLSNIWSDHLIEDMSWLRSDTFSWQDGDVYSLVYNKLLSEYNNASSVEETEGNITFKRTPKGYKIAGATQETAILNKYNSDGIAWYYILDTTNTQFKLPRTTNIEIHGQLIDCGSSGGINYRVYQDGYCEQWGSYRGTHGANLNITINTSKTFSNSDYCLQVAPYSSVNNDDAEIAIMAKNSNNFRVFVGQMIGDYSTTKGFDWKCSGYLAEGQYSSDIENQYDNYKKYLYFYVGEYSQTAIEQTAGLNAELFNGKADVDLGNVTNPILSAPYLKTCYVNGTSGYNIWSNGYCEQWGHVTVKETTINFLKTFADQNYSFYTTSSLKSASSNTIVALRGEKYVNSIFVICYPDKGTDGFDWRACGYLSTGEY